MVKEHQIGKNYIYRGNETVNTLKTKYKDEKNLDYDIIY